MPRLFCATLLFSRDHSAFLASCFPLPSVKRVANNPPLRRTIKWLPTLVMMSLSVMLGSIPSSGQATTGIGGSIQHLGYDSIDLSSLRVTVDVPLACG